jgi:glycosyltransferase involved in cell wall biosynthesis
VGHFPVIATPGNINFNNKEYNGCRVITFKQQANIQDAQEILEKVKPEIVHVHGYKAIFTKACRKLNIPCIVTAHHGGILCPAGALLNYRDEICRIKANHKDCLPCVLKNIRGGFYFWPVLKLFPLKFRLVFGRFMEKLPFILYFTPVLKAALSIQNKTDEWETIHENASLIIAPSAGIADSMIRNGALPEKIKILPHGIPLPAQSSVSEQKNRSKNVPPPPQFFYTGRISHIKGIHIMLAAFDRFNGSAKLHIVGGAGNKVEERYMQRLQRKYRHNSQIIWHGKVENQQIFDFIKYYDILIHPAICMEIFGLNIAEALALGKPVIATRCGGAEIQIEDGVNGWLVEPNDINSLKQAMEVANDRYLTNILFKVDASRVKPIEKHAKELIEIYENLID